MAFLGWLFLAAAYYLYIPIFHTIWLFVWLLIGLGWVSAGVWSFTAVISYLSIRAYVRACVTLTIAVTIGACLWNTDWPITSVKSMIWLRGEAFAEVASVRVVKPVVDVAVQP
jgi:hypothetical protein